MDKDPEFITLTFKSHSMTRNGTATGEVVEGLPEWLIYSPELQIISGHVPSNFSHNDTLKLNLFCRDSKLFQTPYNIEIDFRANSDPVPKQEIVNMTVYHNQDINLQFSFEDYFVDSDHNPYDVNTLAKYNLPDQ